MPVVPLQCVPKGGAMARRLVRKHALLAGVCGGIADSFDWNPTLVRIRYIVISTLSVAVRTRSSSGVLPLDPRVGYD